MGISCDFHDAAAALLRDGRIVAAAEEERFTRSKHDASLPERAMLSCAAIGEIDLDQIDVVVFHEKPLVSTSRMLAARQRVGPRAVPAFVREFPHVVGHHLMLRHRVEEFFRSQGAAPPEVRFGEHHLSHAAAAFLPSPFSTAAVLTYDGIGEWATASFGRGARHRVDLEAELRFPDSLGLLYTLITSWCGFTPNDGEYKLMGLAPYGAPTYLDQLRHLVTVNDDGSFSIRARKVRWWSGDPRRLRRLHSLLGGPPRAHDAALTQREADLARSVQVLTEEIVLRTAVHVADVTGERNLCLAGGVALNCVANGRLLREGPFDDVWVQPAAGDAGSALGAALWYWHVVLGNERDPDGRDAMRGSALGPTFDDAEIGAWLAHEGIASTEVGDLEARCNLVADRLAGGAVVGWVDGPMEFGPRALGHRSVLADPRSVTVQRDLNLRVKGRESFRPFAPAVLWEKAHEWFEIDRPAPYMTTVHRVAPERLLPVEDEPIDLAERTAIPRSTIPACTHVDGSARVQTVHSETNPTFHRLLRAFDELTGCPVLVNTSFNRAGDPIVCTPADALAAARSGGLDLLVLGSHLVDREAIHG